MATYVLVHGGWHGGWCWQRVTPLLRAAGHEVFTPTLTGLGERVHLAHPDIDLHTHIADVVNVLTFEDLHQVLLVGHSYGGAVSTGVAEQVPERLAHLVYLDAPVLEDGQSVADASDWSPERRAAYENMLATDPQAWRVPPGSTRFLGVTEEADIRWLQPKLVPQPGRTVLTPVHRANPAARLLPRTYIWCTDTNYAPLRRTAERLRETPGWRVHALPTGHDAMVTAPTALADLLLDLA
jgi:pimeloyl-ACP methyl ester carboxylesterase